MNFSRSPLYCTACSCSLRGEEGWSSCLTAPRLEDDGPSSPGLKTVGASLAEAWGFAAFVFSSPSLPICSW